MKLTIDIPDDMQQSLQEQFGQNLADAAKEAVAVAWYQAEKLSIGQVAEFLGISVYEAQGLMKQRQVVAPSAVEDFEHDRDTLKRLLCS